MIFVFISAEEFCGHVFLICSLFCLVSLSLFSLSFSGFVLSLSLSLSLHLILLIVTTTNHHHYSAGISCCSLAPFVTSTSTPSLSSGSASSGGSVCTDPGSRRKVPVENATSPRPAAETQRTITPPGGLGGLSACVRSSPAAPLK